jgi:hypothetical protein
MPRNDSFKRLEQRLCLALPAVDEVLPDPFRSASHLHFVGTAQDQFIACPASIP